MQRKWQKATTVAVAGALMASQALMQVSAAGGTINADMSTKTPVMRVVVPTTMAVAVNEFEVGDAGSQITSEEFTMKNVSEIPVSVKVTSTATLGTDVTLVSTKKEAQDSTDAEHPAMWLAAAAAVGKNSTSSALEYAGGSAEDKTAGALAGTEVNVTTFATVTPEGGGTATHTAVQDFYLTAATAPQYKAIVGADAEDIGAGADFYKLTAATMADQDAVNTALETQDLYTVTTAPVSGTAQEITKLAKGTTDTTFGSLTYYTMGVSPVGYDTVKADSTGIYLYIDTATAPTAGGDAAAFRYVGALSSAKTDNWSADSTTGDLKGVAIAYEIKGVSPIAFEKVADDLTYGYKGEDNILTLEDGVLTAKIKIEDFKSGTLKIGDVTASLDTRAGAWGGEDDAVTFTFNSTWADAMKGKTCIATVILQDDSEISASFNVAE